LENFVKHCALLLSLALLAVAATGNGARGDDDAKAAREQVREVKKAWKDASKADKYRLLLRLVRWRENSVAKFLTDVIEDEPDDEVAS
jgi:hypothetical protein